MAELITLAELSIDANKAIAEQARLKKQADELKKSMKQLREENEENTEEYVLLESQLKNTQAEIRANSKVTQALTDDQDKNSVTIKKLRAENAKLNEERNKVNLNTEEGRKRLKELNAQLDANNKVIKENVDSYAKQKINIGNYKEDVKAAIQETQGFNIANQEAAQGLGMLNKGIGVVRKGFTLLLANPIVAFITALVAALGFLFNAFTSTQDGADTMVKWMNRVNGVVDDVIGRTAALVGTLTSFGKAIKQAFTGDGAAAVESLKEGIENAINAFKGFDLDAIFDGADKLSDAQVKLRKLQIEITNATANTRKEYQELLLISRDTAKSEEERREALVKAGEIELQNQANVLRLKRQQLAVALADLESTNDNTKKDEQRLKVAEARKAVADAEADSLARQREILNRIIEVDNKILARDKARAKAAEDQVKATLDELDLELALEEEAAQKELEILLAKNQEITDATLEHQQNLNAARQLLAQDNVFAMLNMQERALKEEYNRAIENANRIGADTTEITARYNRQMAELDKLRYTAMASLASDAFGDIAKIAGEGTAVGKAAAAAQATVQALQAANGAYAALAGIPVVGPALGIAAAAAALASGYANVKAIYAVNSGLPGDSGGGGSAPAQPAAAQIGTTGANLGQGIATRSAIDGTQQPQTETTVAVVTDEVTAAQNTDIKRNAASAV